MLSSGKKEGGDRAAQVWVSQETARFHAAARDPHTCQVLRKNTHQVTNTQTHTKASTQVYHASYHDISRTGISCECEDREFNRSLQGERNNLQR